MTEDECVVLQEHPPVDRSIRFIIDGVTILKIDEHGFTYRDKKIEDVGTAHDAWMHTMGDLYQRKTEKDFPDNVSYLEMARRAMAEIPDSLMDAMDISDEEFIRLRDQLHQLTSR